MSACYPDRSVAKVVNSTISIHKSSKRRATFRDRELSLKTLASEGQTLARDTILSLRSSRQRPSNQVFLSESAKREFILS